MCMFTREKSFNQKDLENSYKVKRKVEKYRNSKKKEIEKEYLLTVVLSISTEVQGKLLKFYIKTWLRENNMIQ